MNKNNGFRPKLPGRGPNALWLLLALVGLGVGYLFWYNSVNREVESVSFSKLLTAIEADTVDSMIVQGQHAQGKFKDGKVFDTYIVPTNQLWDSLKTHKVDVEIYPMEKESWGGYAFFILLFIGIMLFVFYMRQSQNGGGGSSKIFSVGKSKARFFSPNTITVTFKDVAGNQEAKEDVQDIIEFLKRPEHFSRLGAKIPRGVLLTGAPGNGKTLIAKAVAGEANCPFFSISGSDFVEVFVGVGASRVRDLFAQARRHSPCIVFIDEIDAVGRQRGIGMGGGNDEREQTLNQLLAEMDGFSTEQGAVIVIAATNRPDVLDKALLRPGRFDRTIEVPYPDLTSREEILNVHIRNVKCKDIDLHKIAQGTAGFSGADLENLINEAALLASKAGEEGVMMKYFELARDKILLGAERKTIIFTEKDKAMTAHHEAGHALLNLLLPDTDPFHKVTIVPRGRTLGVSWSLPIRDKYSQNKEELVARIIVCFGGLLGERMFFNTQTSGCSNDLEQATKIARTMVCRYGMSDLGPIDYDSSQENPYVGRDMQNGREFSERTAQRIDEEVEKIMGDCYRKGEQLLQEHRDKLALLAKTLIEKETVQAAEVYVLLDLPPRETHVFESK